MCDGMVVVQKESLQGAQGGTWMVAILGWAQESRIVQGSQDGTWMVGVLGWVRENKVAGSVQS